MSRESQVKEFMTLMNQIGSPRPNETSLKMRQLAVKLTFEELRELAEALDVMGTFANLCATVVEKDDYVHYSDGDDVDEVEAVDAFGDIEFTNLWGVVMTGLDSEFGNAFDEICRSNNSKACNSEEEAQKGVEFYKEKGIDVEIVPSLGKFVLIDGNGKVKKSPFYSPADLSKYVPSK